ncbi:MAG: GNAT family N-acetyltransferase [Hydrogenovibrio sp.]|uniref:GNAT family N-acetyltransferase n=1 Tax=Hydrogenovibrio sp. TaxID=2065821 RepID=UPI00287068EE|nr:GNAT family N-acetyltransferase [Hydrogenovibrio sp.]MDR9498523.1 GNAT family N-acetyltransferase [Hydrogenovibrio sp.]MDR9499247.1 GNAT family N-acetyltransferase [Hydrogenovibrio sp.]
MSNKEKYRLFCEQEKTIPIFSQAWWLDVVAGDAWDVCLVENGEEILASMPYVTIKRYGFTLLSHPPLTQNLGPWLKPSQAKYSKMLSQQKDWMQSLIEQLPKYDYFNQSWYYTQTNWLPFYWHGFEQSTRYTYVIEYLSNVDNLWADLQENIRREIRKAENKAGVTVKTDLPIEDFIDLNEMTFSRQGMTMPYTRRFVKRLVEKAKARNQCQWFIGQDEAGQNHAGVLIIWDEQAAYYLLGGGNPDLRNSGATSLCMWEAIKFVSNVTKKFDFEGSMIEPIERFFRGFGAVQKPYFTVTHKPSQILNTMLCLKKAIKG